MRARRPRGDPTSCCPIRLPNPARTRAALGLTSSRHWTGERMSRQPDGREKQNSELWKHSEADLDLALVVEGIDLLHIGRCNQLVFDEHRSGNRFFLQNTNRNRDKF